MVFANSLLSREQMGINFGDLVSQNVTASGFLAIVPAGPRTLTLVQLSNVLLFWPYLHSFNSVRQGTHILFREFSFVQATPHNRASFLRTFWRCFRTVGKNGGKYSSICWCSATLTLKSSVRLLMQYKYRHFALCCNVLTLLIGRHRHSCLWNSSKMLAAWSVA